jgi:aldehyde dehydrogenase (NAD(P)+)
MYSDRTILKMTYSHLDQAIHELKTNKERWLQLSINERCRYLREMLDNVPIIAPEWVQKAAIAKQLPPELPHITAEDWMSGPWAIAHWLKGMIETFEGLEAGKPGRFKPKMVRVRKNGQVVVRVLPLEFYDHILISGLKADVWMQPEVTADNITEHIASIYRQPPTQGKLVLVLGAGNIASIPFLDALYKLVAELQVVLLKMNPVIDYLLPCFESLFAPLIREGFVRIVSGDVNVGKYLTDHPDIDEIHITGSIKSHEAIVFGTGEEAQERKARQQPLITKRITSELGNVSPTVIVPGPWGKADIDYYAQYLMVHGYHNGGYDCLGTQVLVLPQEWALSDSFLDRLRHHLKNLPNRFSYYPGTAERHTSILKHYPQAETFDNSEGQHLPRVLIPGLSPEDTDNLAFKEEFFCNILTETRLPGASPLEYLKNVVKFCNEVLHGTLAANIIIHPKTLKALGEEFEPLLDELKYGGIGVNVWSGGNFLLSQATWGAYPGADIYTTQSGIGVVHNNFLFDKPQKTVMFGGFYSIPRAWLHGEFHLMPPKPIWFLDHRRAHIVTEKVVNLTAHPNPLRLPSIVWNALWA